ncbi:MAG TPA: hypothetical protein V6C85_20305 [Allocoleopsis sp.]
MEIYPGKAPKITLTVPKTQKIRGITASLQQLPRVPSIGESLIVDMLHRHRRYSIKVIDIVYKLRIDCDSEDSGTCEAVEIIGECTNWQEIAGELEEGADDDVVGSSHEAQIDRLMVSWQERKDNSMTPVLVVEQSSHESLNSL